VQGKLKEGKLLMPSVRWFHVKYTKYLAIIFWVVLLMISFEDLTWIFYIWVSNTTIEDTMKKIQFKQHFATTFKLLTKKVMVLVY